MAPIGGSNRGAVDFTIVQDSFAPYWGDPAPVGAFLTPLVGPAII
jgi:hypothetical protein